MEKLKKIFKNNIIIILCIIALALKQSVYLGAVAYDLSGDTYSGLYLNSPLTYVHTALLMIFVIPVFFFKNRWKDYYMVGLNTLFSIYCVIDLWIYRATNHFSEVRYLLYPELMNTTGESLFQPRKMDILFFIDVVILIILLIIGFNKNKKSNISIKGAIVFIVGIIATCIIFIQIGEKNGKNFFTYESNPATNSRIKGIVGYKVFEAYDSIKKYNEKSNSTEISEVSKWLEDNKEDLPDNEYKGLFKGKNVILLQIESLENFVIGQSVYGQEITPNLNKILNNSLYFSNIYEQNNYASSIDCDLMVNTSVLPLGDRITTLQHPYKNYLSLPKVLKDDGYTSVLTHVEYNSAWYWAEAGVKYGYDKIWGIKEFDLDENVGYGLSDESFYRQFKEKIKTLPQPFFSLSPTLTSHGPFEYDEKYKYLDLPEEVDNNIMGGYLQGIHYADKQIGTFLSDLDAMGYLDNTVVIIYGDHAGVNKYYKNQLEGLNMEGDWWKVDELKVPLIIYSKGMEGKEFDVNGGIVDLYPTLCYLLDTTNKDYKNYVMGRNLLNTNRTATVIPSGIKGSPSSEAEKNHLEKAYDIGRKYILNEYYENNK